MITSLIVSAGCWGGQREVPSTTAASGAPSGSTSAPTTTAPAVTSTTKGTPSTNLPGESPTQAQRLSPTEGTFATCKDCHSFLDPQGQTRHVLNATFSHEKHIARGTACEACHVTPVHEENAIRRPGMAQCYACHNERPGATAPADCDLCHPPEFKKLPASHDARFYKGGHAAVAKAQGTAECFTCHPGDETTFCKGCHKLDMPHPAGWARAPGGGAGLHVEQAYADPDVCVMCHQNKVGPPAGCFGGECHGS